MPGDADRLDRLSYALGLHMHQPPGNLRLLIETNPWEARQILCCYERVVRYIERWQGRARIHVGFSGILLEQFRDPAIVELFKDILDIPEMIARYRRAADIEFLGMGYYHPIFPLIPREDWAEQLRRGREIVREMFGREPQGFWPPEMAFSMEMIPALREAGYTYVVVDHVHVRPQDGGPLDCFQPYFAEYEGARITVVPRHRDISNAQESGMNPEWFVQEVGRHVRMSPDPEGPRLLTTWSDGENGGWFRQLDDEAGFFGYFFAPLARMMTDGRIGARFVSLSEYLAAHPPGRGAVVRTGAWNVGATDGMDFAQWEGSEAQRRALQSLHDLRARCGRLERGASSQETRRRLARIRDVILEAETSCYLFWGEAWLPKLHERLETAAGLMKELEEEDGPHG